MSSLQGPNLEKAAHAQARNQGESALTLPPTSARDNEEDVDMDEPTSYEHDTNQTKAHGGMDPTPLISTLTETGLDEETTLNQGIGSTLSLLTQRGLLQRGVDEDVERFRSHQKFLADVRKRKEEAESRARAQRERDRASGKLDRMSAREREEYARWENKQRDQAESRQVAEVFNREYKPNVQLKYVDDFGRSMNQKEAFKHLSHQFHGKGSGKQKTEKMLKKIDEEKKREAQSMLDSGSKTGMTNAQSATAKKNKQAAVRLA